MRWVFPGMREPEAEGLHARSRRPSLPRTSSPLTAMGVSGHCECEWLCAVERGPWMCQGRGEGPLFAGVISCLFHPHALPTSNPPFPARELVRRARGA